MAVVQTRMMIRKTGVLKRIPKSVKRFSEQDAWFKTKIERLQCSASAGTALRTETNTFHDAPDVSAPRGEKNEF